MLWCASSHRSPSPRHAASRLSTAICERAEHRASSAPAPNCCARAPCTRRPIGGRARPRAASHRACNLATLEGTRLLLLLDDEVPTACVNDHVAATIAPPADATWPIGDALGFAGARVDAGAAATVHSPGADRRGPTHIVPPDGRARAEPPAHWDGRRQCHLTLPEQHDRRRGMLQRPR